MSCYDPRPCWFSTERSETTGARLITFSQDQAIIDQPVTLKCGKCIGCKQDRANDWSVRLQHEAEMWPSSIFATFTYSDDQLVRSKTSGLPTLYRPHFQLFMKRLRKAFPHRTIRFFQCGEYGETTRRPHHHALLFNLALLDSQRCRKSGDNYLYRSPQLQRLWSHGQVEHGNITIASAAYVSGYACKLTDNTPPGCEPEYHTMSRTGGGIGGTWINKFESDIYRHDAAILPTTRRKPPRFYDKKLKAKNPALYSQIIAERFRKKIIHDVTTTWKTLSAKETIHKSRLKEKKRS